MKTGYIKDYQKDIINEIENKRDVYIDMSHQIHDHPEIGNQEIFSSGLLVDTLEKEGFFVKKALAGHPTSFIARKNLVKVLVRLLDF